MLNKIYKISLFTVAVTLPIFAGAQLGKTTSFFSTALALIRDTITPLVFILAVLFFFYGVAKYILSAGGEKEEGKKIMIWGVIALFVMSSIWGIVTVLQGEFGVTSQSSMPIPKFQ